MAYLAYPVKKLNALVRESLIIASLAKYVDIARYTDLFTTARKGTNKKTEHYDDLNKQTAECHFTTLLLPTKFWSKVELETELRSRMKDPTVVRSYFMSCRATP